MPSRYFDDPTAFGPSNIRRKRINGKAIQPPSPASPGWGGPELGAPSFGPPGLEDRFGGPGLMRNLSGPPTPVGPGPDQPPLRTLANLDPSRRAIAEQMIAKYGLDAFQRGGTPEIAASSGSDPYAGDMRTAPRYSETDVGGLNGQVVGVRSPTYQRPSIFDTLANGVTQPPARTPSGYQATVGDPYAGNMLAAPVTRGGALPTGQQLFDTGTGVQTGYGAPRPSGATLDWYDPSTDPYAGEMLPAPVTRPWERADQFFDPTTGVQTGYGGLQPSPEGYTAPTTTPVPSPGMRDVFAAHDRSMNLPGSIPSGIGMDALRGQEAGVLAVPERQHLFLNFPGGVPRFTRGAERLRPEEATVTPTGGLPTLIELGFTPESARQAPTALGNALIRSSVLYQGIDPSTAGQAYLDQNYPITTDVTPTVPPAVPLDTETGMQAGYGGLQPSPEGYTAPTTPGGPGWGLGGIDPTTMAEAEAIPVGGGPPRDPSAEGLFDATGMMLPGADVTAAAQPLPTGISASPNDLSPEEFELAWQQIQYRGTLDPGAIRSTIDPETKQPLGLTPQSAVLIEAFRDKEARKATTRAFEEKQFRAGQQFGLQKEQWEAAQEKIIADEARLARQEALEEAQLGLAERVWNPDYITPGGIQSGRWEMRAPSTLAERQLGQQRTEAQRAESFRRAQLAEQVAGREAQATQVQLAREQESELARLAMGVRGEPTYDDWGRAIPGAIPSTLGQRQLEEQVTARGQEQQLARLAMGLGPTGTMDPSQTLASRRFDEERKLERVRMGLDPTATMDPTQTLAARQFAAQMGIGDEGREAIPYQQLELQRALAGLAGKGGEIPQTLAERQFKEQQRLANIQAGITAGQPTTEGLPFRQFEEQERQAREAEAIRRIQLGIPLGDLEKVLPGDFRTRAELEAGLERTSREQQASMQRDLERTLAKGARGLTEREQNIQRRLAEISLGLDTEGQQALPYRQFTEQVRATKRGEALQQAALQGRISGGEQGETLAGRAQTEAERAAEIREALERAQLLGTLDGTDTLEAQLARGGLTGMFDQQPTLERAQISGVLDEQPTLEAELARRQLTEAERAAPVREALERAQVFGAEDGEFTLEAQLARAGLTGMFDQQPTLERARLFGGAGGVPTLEAELARAGLTGMLGEDPTLARRQLAQQGETASLNALVNVFQSAMQNPYAFSAMRTMAGGGAPFANLLAPLGFAMPGQVGQGAGQFFPGGTPTMGQFAEADPEGLNYLQALLGFSGVSPAQLAQLSAGITPGVRALLPPGMGTFRGRGLR